MDDEGKLPQPDCSGDALLHTASPHMLPLTAPHTSPSLNPSSAPQSRVPRGALAKETCSRTQLPQGCCLWQPVRTTGTCFNCCWDASCAPANPGHCLGPGAQAAQPSIPGGKPRSLFCSAGHPQPPAQQLSLNPFSNLPKYFPKTGKNQVSASL